MTGQQVEAILKNMGISSFSNIKVKDLNTIIMSQNFYVVPSRDYFTFDFTTEMIKIKQRYQIKNSKGEIIEKDYSDNKFDIYFDMNNIVGFEFLSPRSRY